MDFPAELDRILPADLPNRVDLILKGSEHLRLIVEANSILNLTRIVDPREAAIKHVLDCVTPWRLFAETTNILDAGTGAGFPGIPLALVFPMTRITMCESIQKKARFVASAVEALKLPNCVVAPQRAEDLLGDMRAGVVTARAVAPLSRILNLFRRAFRPGLKILLYKGPDGHMEIEQAAAVLRQLKLNATIAMHYELPDGMGHRSIIEISKPG